MFKMTTSIEDLIDHNEDGIISSTDTILDQILDMESSHDKRLSILNLIDDKTIIEIVNKINSMYLISGTILLKEFIISICKHSTIQDILKIESCKILCQKEPTIIDNYKLLDGLIIQHSQSLPVPCKLLSIVFLTYCKELSDRALIHLQDFVSNEYIECDFRYKTIFNLDLVNHLDKDTYIFPLLMYFIKNQTIFTTYRIMGCQNLLQNFTSFLSPPHKNYIYTILYSFASDEELDYNLRADATDVLLGLGDEHHQTLARDMIAILGNRGKTIFDDAQNIHNTTIDNSTEPILKTLFNKSMKDGIHFTKIKDIMLSPIQYQIKELEERLKTLNITFNRIEMDRSLYGSVNTTLNSLLCRVYNWIDGHPHQTELTKRLEEELMEASGKCSTGYGTRLLIL